MKLLFVAEWSEKFATRMLYLALLARIHWQPAITSLVRATPSSAMTSTFTRFACGVAPVYPGAPPAAIPATKVPWPRPSPGESFGSVLSLTFASTRLPKSARFSIPESTTAIVGAPGPGVGALMPVQF